MNEQLQAKLVEILASIQSAAKAGGDFAMSQLPDIAQSYVMYGRASLTITLFLCLLIPSVAWYFVIKYWKQIADGGNEPILMVPGIGTVVAVMAFFIHLSEFLMVWFAPKVWLIKEIAHLIK